MHLNIKNIKMYDINTEVGYFDYKTFFTLKQEIETNRKIILLLSICNIQ